ncbi:hypothetical protein H0R90_05575 [Treponema putidum]|uniref:hypothetical protein n=1 Tax=Treponema putidum TaxID=221027 RepID=UPI00119B4DE3|nr:hypothetical protein [Treponema putidum]TWI77522.1 hypothetical protein JM98_01215 [Treponema putidum]
MAKYTECLNDIGNRIIDTGWKKAKLNGTKPLDEINKLWEPMFGRGNIYKRTPKKTNI